MTTHLPKGKNLRAHAAWLVYMVLENGRSTRDIMPGVLKLHSQPRDKNWINEVVLGVLRHLPHLQLQLKSMVSKPLKGDKKVIEHLVLVGFYQLTFMRVSPHAAINETVEACSSLGASKLKGLVNAVLRRHQKEGLPEVEHPHIKYGLPKWLYQLIASHYTERQFDLLGGINEKTCLWLRINTTKVSVEGYLKLLDEQGIGHQLSESHPQGVIIEHCAVQTLPGYEQGYFSVQDGAAQLAGTLVAPQKGDRILDCCAAPGGKACHLFEIEPTADILAIDNSPHRLTLIEENANRLGARLTVANADALDPDEWWDGKLFDRILLDAPCSATGVIRRHPDIRWLRKKSDIENLKTAQHNLLDAIWQLLKPGGYMVYATCSILPEENSCQIDQFLERTPNASRDMEDKQILPGEQQMDGFFYARLLKS